MPRDSTEFGIEMAPGLFHRNNAWTKAMSVLFVVGIARAGEFVNPALSIRDYVPEPFDVPDHIGNIGGMALFTFAGIHGWLRASHEKAVTREWFEQDLKRTAWLVGGITVAANVFAETVGYGSASTSDPIDVVYGLAGGYIVYRASKPDFLSEMKIDEVLGLATRIETEDTLSTDEQELATRFGTYKQKIQEFRARLASAKQQKATPRAIPSPKNQPRNKKRSPNGGRYTPPKKNR